MKNRFNRSQALKRVISHKLSVISYQRFVHADDLRLFTDYCSLMNVYRPLTTNN
jgi:hypothetical protein